MILNSAAMPTNVRGMKTYLIALSLTILLALCSNGAHAACYAGYKAKQDDPLRLHYGVAEVPDNGCGQPSAAAEALRPRLAQAGWTLLTIVETFGEDKLQEHEARAGKYFLRY